MDGFNKEPVDWGYKKARWRIQENKMDDTRIQYGRYKKTRWRIVTKNKDGGYKKKDGLCKKENGV